MADEEIHLEASVVSNKIFVEVIDDANNIRMVKLCRKKAETGFDTAADLKTFFLGALNIQLQNECDMYHCSDLEERLVPDNEKMTSFMSYIDKGKFKIKKKLNLKQCEEGTKSIIQS